MTRAVLLRPGITKPAGREWGIAPTSLRERGIALLVMLTFVMLWTLSLFVGQLSARRLQAQAAYSTMAALAQAKQELIADSAFRTTASNRTRLRLPDIGAPSITYREGNETGGFTGNTADVSVVGRFPWRTLDAGPLRDSVGECLWYAVSGRFKVTPPTAGLLNWDTPGQIDVVDASGNPIETNLAALLIAPGAALDGQDRHLDNPAYLECGGNYEAKNYLDPYAASDAPTGEANYFSGTNSRVTPGTGNKRLVLADSAHYNDRFLGIRVDEIFDLYMKRKDFRDTITTLLASTAGVSTITGTKGTDNLSCASGDVFCHYWREMLFLTALTLPSSVTIDGISFTDCSRVAIFSGRRAANQYRRSFAEKADKTNYLEAPNASSFAVPVASSATFSGTATFNWRTPSADVIRCLP